VDIFCSPPIRLPAGTLAGNSTGSTARIEAITPGAGLSLSAGVLSVVGSTFDGIVDTYADLPTANPPALNSIYVVRTSTGAWFINRKQRGLYQRIATTGVRASDWQYLGEWLEEFSDANFSLYNSSDNTKALAFNLSGITTGTTRTLTVPNTSGTIVLQGALTGSGLTMATSRLLGRTTASTGAVEELTVGSSLTLSAGSLDAVQDIRTTASPTFGTLSLSGSAFNFLTFARSGGKTGYLYADNVGVGIFSGVNATRTGFYMDDDAGVTQFQANGTVVAATKATGFEVRGALETANPSGGTSAAWKLGSKGTAAVTLDTAHYVEIDIAGTAVKLAIVT